MKKFVSIIFVLLISSFLQAGAFDGAPSTKTVGLGIILGSPTGLSGRFALSKENSIDFALSYSSNHNDHDDDYHYHIHADYLYKFYDVIAIKKGELPFYAGIGARITEYDRDHHDYHHDDETFIGLRVPGGIQYEFANAPFEIFAEIALILDVVPEMDVDFNAGLGARFCF